MSISMGAFVAGPSQGRDNPVGVGAVALHNGIGMPASRATQDTGMRDERWVTTML
jgi:hypothetical protein